MGVRSAINWLLLGATAALVASVRAEIATDGEVLVLTDDTFEQAITEHKAVLVKVWPSHLTAFCTMRWLRRKLNGSSLIRWLLLPLNVHDQHC